MCLVANKNNRRKTKTSKTPKSERFSRPSEQLSQGWHSSLTWTTRDPGPFFKIWHPQQVAFLPTVTRPQDGCWTSSSNVQIQGKKEEMGRRKEAKKSARWNFPFKKVLPKSPPSNSCYLAKTGLHNQPFQQGSLGKKEKDFWSKPTPQCLSQTEE